MHPEPVSEVFLTNGTILRQTHYGTTPREASPFMDSYGSDSPAKVRKVSETSLLAQKTSDSGLVTDQLKIDEAKKLAEPSNENVSKSPYMLIGSPIPEGQSNERTPGTDDLNAEKPPVPDVDEVDAPLKTDNTYDLPNLRDIVCSKNETTNDNASDNESLTVEYDDDTGELTDNQSVVGDDDSNFPESECQSEIETAEEEDDDIQLGQSAVDFEGKQKDLDIPKASVAKAVKGKSSGSATGAALIEFPKIDEERLERIEYLTPNEVKAMQVARRRRNEWESRIRSVKEKEKVKQSMPQKIYAKERALPFTDGHFDDKGAVLPPAIFKKKTDKVGPKIKTIVMKKSSSQITVRSINQNPADVEQVVEKKEMKNKAKKSGPVKNRILKRLSQHVLESSAEESANTPLQRGRRQAIKKVDANNPPPQTSSFEPVKNDVQNTDTVPNVKKGESSSNLLVTPTKQTVAVPSAAKSEMKSQTLNYHRMKRMGHRRMKSAPLIMASSYDEVKSVPSELTPESPFIFVSPVPAKDEVRMRSSSVGNRSRYTRGQKELTRLAELVVHEDRLDAERDVPEVLQVSRKNLLCANDCFSVTMMSDTSAQKIHRQRISILSDVLVLKGLKCVLDNQFLL